MRDIYNRRNSIQWIQQEDIEYPEKLRPYKGMPKTLYVLGGLPDPSRPSVAVVGARRSTSYGDNIARQFSAELAANGIQIISGLAWGIDTAAHTGALEGGGETYAVMGCGVDVCYPAGNRKLYDWILQEKRGGIISEQEPGRPPLAGFFPARNRIISGLSCGVVVVEAPEKSGALLTAKYALEQGRDVFVIPGNVDNEGFRGSNRLLRAGAIAVATGQEIMEEYEGIYPDKLSQIRENSTVATPEKTVIPKKLKKKTIDNGDSPPYSEQNDPLAGLSEEERTVMNAIGSGIQSVDDVIARSGLPSGKVLGLLTMLEIKKKIVRYPGKRVSWQR